MMGLGDEATTSSPHGLMLTLYMQTIVIRWALSIPRVYCYRNGRGQSAAISMTGRAEVYISRCLRIRGKNKTRHDDHDRLFQQPLHHSLSSSEQDSTRIDRQIDSLDPDQSCDAYPTMASASSSQLVVGTRKSNLALIQTHYVADLLAGVNPGTTFPVLDMTTVGDRNQTTPLHLLSPYNSKQPAKSLWTDELESALLDGRMDLLVHSCKDVPTVLRDGCEIAALLERHDPRDALVIKKGLQYKSLDELPAGSVVGTGSVRRVAQLSRAYPKLKFADMVSDAL